MSIRIKVEVACDECKGSGAISNSECTEVDCSVCEGEGYSEIKMPLLHLKNLLEGGTL